MREYAVIYVCLMAICLAICGLISVPSIHAWERQAGYPYGKMCNSVFTGYVDTCRKPAAVPYPESLRWFD